jgi:hypothetical protein
MTEENQYYPEVINVDDLKNTDFRPAEIKEQLILDLQKYDNLENVEFKVFEVTKK